MSLTGAMQIGRSALVSSQVGIQVAGNNLANAATPGYSRQTVELQPQQGERIGSIQIGRGVTVRAVERQVDEALEARLRGSIGENAYSTQRANTLQQLETTLNELTGYDLSSELSGFFSVWSDAANLIGSPAVVIEQGARLASYAQSLRGSLTELRDQVETDIDNQVNRVNDLLDEVADLNTAIASTEVGVATANELRDKRGMALEELAGFLEISTVEDKNSGILDVFVGSEPVVINGESRRLKVSRETDGDKVTAEVRLESDNSRLQVGGGSVGGLLATRDAEIDDTIDRLDELASRLIFEVNKLHSTGANKPGMTSVSGSVQVAVPDRTLSLSDPANATAAAMMVKPVNGGFLVNVTNQATGVTKQTRIDVDMDGIDSTFGVGFADDTSIQDLADALNAVAGLQGSVDAQGRLSVTSDAGFEFSFEDDTSGVLAALGVNTFFTGTDATDIAVRGDLLNDSSKLMVGRMSGGAFIENGTALAITDLRNTAMTELGGMTVGESWSGAVQTVASRSAFAQSSSEASALVMESLSAQRSSLSGVDLDEETMSLMTYQRQFQGAARLIGIADELLQTLIAIA